MSLKGSSALGLPEPFGGEQTMLILVGLIASGKSTFAEALERHFSQFRRCNQDSLGTRQQVEDLARHTLLAGMSPCIDRTNVNARQRAYWTDIAHEFPGTSISVIVFDTPYQTCASRLQQRTSHPTIKSVQEGMSVLAKFASDLRLPLPYEGYDHIVYIRPSDHSRPEYSRDEILSILQRLKASTRDTGPGNNQLRTHPYFGNSRFARTGNPPSRFGYWYQSTNSQSHSSNNPLPRRGGKVTPPHPSRVVPRTGGSSESNWRRTSHHTNQGGSSPARVPPLDGSTWTGPGTGSPDDPMIIS